MDNPEKFTDNNGKDTGKDRIKAIIILSILLIVILIGVYFIFNLKSDKPVGTANYEIIMKDITGNELTMQIYSADTTETNLLNINNDILKQFNDSTMTKYIFYFDDKNHTGRFFELFTKGNLSSDEQNEMSHNIAMYYYEKSMTKSNPPCLTKRATQGWKIIKCYN